MLKSRRHFMRNTAVTTCGLPIFRMRELVAPNMRSSEELEINVFSKHLQFLDWKEIGVMAAELGFDGVDLTVRPKGHVLPDQVIRDLPQAISDIKEGGSHCEMITTSVESVDNPTDIDVIKTAGAQGVSYYRTNWYRYLDDKTMSESISYYQDEVYRLGKLNAKHNIIGCYQNHAGIKIGASYWEVYQLLQKVDPSYFGVQYDIRHTTVDSGVSWPNGLELLRDKIKVIVLKDFKWGRVGSQWEPINVPIGEGMVDFDTYFKLLKSYNLKPPVSLHLEYPLGGAEKGKNEITIDKKVVYDAMIKDLKAIRTLWRNA